MIINDVMKMEITWNMESKDFLFSKYKMGVKIQGAVLKNSAPYCEWVLAFSWAKCFYLVVSGTLFGEEYVKADVIKGTEGIASKLQFS